MPYAIYSIGRRGRTYNYVGVSSTRRRGELLKRMLKALSVWALVCASVSRLSKTHHHTNLIILYDVHTPRAHGICASIKKEGACALSAVRVHTT